VNFDAWANRLIVFSLHDAAFNFGVGAGADWIRLERLVVNSMSAASNSINLFSPTFSNSFSLSIHHVTKGYRC
jgi:hypothetical protein